LHEGRVLQISLVPSVTLKKFLGQASEAYYHSVKDEPDAIAYLKRRGISGASAQLFRLGVVTNPLPGHEPYRGRLCIPYLTRAGVVSLRFRCIGTEHPDIEDCKDVPGHPKYLGLPGDTLRLFNPEALHKSTDHLVITEGEIDAITAVQAGLPAVGLPGVSALREYTPRMLKGYDRVYVLADNDDKGQGGEFSQRVAELVDNARVVFMPPGDDVNSFVCREGPDALLEKIGEN
jgi:DNA primase